MHFQLVQFRNTSSPLQNRSFQAHNRTSDYAEKNNVFRFDARPLKGFKTGSQRHLEAFPVSALSNLGIAVTDVQFEG